jgi:hypothetical protein
MNEANSDVFNRFIYPFLIFNGLTFNITIFIILIHKKKEIKSRSRLLNEENFDYIPFRYLMIAILVCDIYYLLNKLNIWFFFILNKDNLTSFDFLCQIIVYLDYISAILTKFYILIGNYIAYFTLSRHNPFMNENFREKCLIYSNNTSTNLNTENNSIAQGNNSIQKMTTHISAKLSLGSHFI